MKQLITLLALVTIAQASSAQQYKPYPMRYDKTFFCGCEVADSVEYRRTAITDSTRAIYDYMRSRPHNNSSHIPLPDNRTYYHLKTGSFYLEDDK